MRKRVGDPYETVGIIGSFRKHVEGINEAWEVFTKAGFEVLAPREPIKPIDPNVDFVILESDTSDDPLKLEAAYWGELKKSDVVLVCNPGGHTGATVMFELGGLVHSGAEVYFTHEPGESLIRAMADYAMSVCSAEELVEEMNSHNRTFNLREWPDADRVQASNFSLPQP